MHVQRLAVTSILIVPLLFLTFSFAVLTQEAPLGEQVSPEADDILIEGAKATWEAETVMSKELQAAMDKVLPRMVIEQAASLWGADLRASQGLVTVAGKVTASLLIEQAAITSILDLNGSDALIDATSETTPRILVEYAATTRLIQDLQGSAALLEATNKMAPRILIEHAETMQCYGLRPFDRPVPPAPPPSPSVHLWWIVLGLLGAAVLVIVLTRLP